MPLRHQNIIRIIIVVAVILLVPLVLTIRDHGVGWNWSPGDFVVMGALLFITGLAIDSAWRKITAPAHRAVAIALIVFAFLLIWTELAVDAVGQLLDFLF